MSTSVAALFLYPSSFIVCMISASSSFANAVNYIVNRLTRLHRPKSLTHKQNNKRNAGRKVGARAGDALVFMTDHPSNLDSAHCVSRQTITRSLYVTPVYISKRKKMNDNGNSAAAAAPYPFCKLLFPTVTIARPMPTQTLSQSSIRSLRCIIT